MIHDLHEKKKIWELKAKVQDQEVCKEKCIEVYWRRESMICGTLTI